MYYREPKKHKELRQIIRKSCNTLRLNNEIDPGCHVLYMLMHEKLGGQICYTIQDVIQVANTTDTYPLPLQASRLCDLAEVLSRRNRILFLRNTKFSERSLIVPDINTFLNKIVMKIYMPHTSDQHLSMPYQNGLLPLSHIKHQLPNIDSSLVIDVLSELKLCQVVLAPDLLGLIRFGRAASETSSSNSFVVPSHLSPALNHSSHDQQPNYVEKPSTSLPYATSVEHERVAKNETYSKIPKHSEHTNTSASIPPSPLCEGARESFSPQWCTAPESASKIKDQIYALGALAVGSQPILHSTSMKMPNEIRQVMSFHSLHSSSVLHLNESHHKSSKHRLSTSSLQTTQAFEIDNDLYENDIILSINSSSSSLGFRDKSGMNYRTEGVSLGCHTKQQNVCQNTSDCMHQTPSHNCLLSSVEAKKTVPTRRRSSLVQTQYSSDSNDERMHLLFPGLICLDQPNSEVWLHDKSFVWYSGWCLQCSSVHHFFSPWFIQSLILFLTFNFVASNNKGTNTLSTQEYNIWKKGMRWLSQNGTEIFVELVDDEKVLVVLMRSVKGAETEGVELRSSLIKAVFDIKQTCCPSMPTSECFIDPSHLKEIQGKYPLINGPWSCLVKYDIRDMAKTVVQATCGTRGLSIRLL